MGAHLGHGGSMDTGRRRSLRTQVHSREKKAALNLRGMARMANALVGERKKKSCKKGPCPGLSGPGQGQLPQVRTPMYCGIYLQQRGRMQELGSSCERRESGRVPE